MHDFSTIMKYFELFWLFFTLPVFPFSPHSFGTFFSSFFGEIFCKILPVFCQSGKKPLRIIAEVMKIL